MNGLKTGVPLPSGSAVPPQAQGPQSQTGTGSGAVQRSYARVSPLPGVLAGDLYDAPKLSVQGMVLPGGLIQALEVGSRGLAWGNTMDNKMQVKMWR